MGKILSVWGIKQAESQDVKIPAIYITYEKIHFIKSRSFGQGLKSNRVIWYSGLHLHQQETMRW